MLDRSVKAGVLKRWDRQHPIMVPAHVRGPIPLFRMGGHSGTDWIALADPTSGLPPYWAIEAKAIEGDSLGVSKLAKHQIQHLNACAEINQGALLLVRFLSTDGWGEEFAVPWRYAPWRRNGAGMGLHKDDVLHWRVTGVEALKGAMSWKK